jgi:hypothetical protein
MGPKRSIVLDAVIERIDEHPDHGSAADVCQEIATDERAVSLSVSQESTVFHSFPNRMPAD